MYLALLFMHAACEFDRGAMGLLLAVRHADGPDTLTAFDAGVIIALYLSIHDTRPRERRFEVERTHHFWMHDRSVLHG